MGTAATKAKNKYQSKAYDRLNIIIPKGRKEDLQDYAAAVGQSLNGYVVQAIDERIERDNAKGDEAHD